MELPDGESILGRSLACRMRFNDSSVSRKHVCIRVRAGDVVLQDLGSHNGTFVNGEPVTSVMRLSDGDEIAIGSRRVKISIADASDGSSDDPTQRTVPMPDVAPPLAHGSEVKVEQRCPDCKNPVSFEDDLCDHCGYSWADFRPLSHTRPVKTQAAAGAERRRHQRHKVEVPILYNSDNLTVESMALDLSRSGVFVRTHILDEVGTRCTLTLMVDGGPALTFHGRVCRVVDSDRDGALGLGIEFCDLTQNARRWLDDTLARVRSP